MTFHGYTRTKRSIGTGKNRSCGCANFMGCSSEAIACLDAKRNYDGRFDARLRYIGLFSDGTVVTAVRMLMCLETK